MLLTLLLQSLLTGLVACAVIFPRTPPTALSTGFLLVVNVTDLAHDLIPSVHGWVLQAYHVGAGLNAAVLHPLDGENPGRVFYLNGSSLPSGTGPAPPISDDDTVTTTILTDEGAPPFPYGLYVQKPNETDAPLYPGDHAASIDVGHGTPAAINQADPVADPSAYPFLTNGLAGESGGTFLACNRSVEYYDTYMATLDYAYATFDPSAALATTLVPAECAPIRLVPQCATLADVPAGALANHDFAVPVACYDDVAGVDWNL